MRRFRTIHRRRARSSLGSIDAHQVQFINECAALLPPEMRHGYLSRVSLRLKLSGAGHVITDAQVERAANLAMDGLWEAA